VSAEENEVVSRRIAEELWSEGNLDIADELLAPDFVDHDPSFPDGVRGPEGVKEEVTTFQTAVPDLKVSVKEVIADEDRVAVRWRATGTHRGELLGMAPTGNTVGIDGIAIDHFSEGKVAESWTLWDVAGLMRQLGAG
jgi:steroid delta-isomerase-like uncharacterized protein